MSDDYVVMFVLGGPGSGKGTQCAKIVEKYGWKHFSAGDLLRAEVASGSDQGEMLQDIMNEGGIVPFEITIGLIHKAMKASNVNKFLIDGFPRALDQAEAFESSVCVAKAMLFLDCPEEVMEKRLLGRAEGRIDDNPATIQKRFKVYVQQTMPVIKSFEDNGRLRKVDATRTPDEVFEEVRKIVEDIEGAHVAPSPVDVTRPVAGPATPSVPPGAAAATDASPATKPASHDTLAAPAAANDTSLIDFGASASTPALDPASAASEAPGSALKPAPSPAQSAWATPFPATSPPAAALAPSTAGVSAPVATPASSKEPPAPPIVVIGPSGVGKGTLIARLMAELPGKVAVTVSHTTRRKRPEEQEGVQYHFTDRADFEAAVARGEFLEYAEVHGNLYGTSKSAVDACSAQGKVAVLEIDVQGARQIKRSSIGSAAHFVFIKPVSFEVLEARIRGRNSESEESIALRLANAQGELEAADDKSLIDTVIVNDDLEIAVKDLKAVAAHHMGLPSDADGHEEAVRVRAKEYLTETVVGALKVALIELNKQRPDDPLQFLIEQLEALKAARDGQPAAVGAPAPSLL